MPVTSKHRSLGSSPNWQQKLPIPVEKDRNLDINQLRWPQGKCSSFQLTYSFLSCRAKRKPQTAVKTTGNQYPPHRYKKAIAVAHMLWSQVTAQHQTEVMNHGPLLTKPYAVLLSCSWVISATYAKITEKVTANTPDMEITAKYHLWDETDTMRWSTEKCLKKPW